jgi:transketolase
MMRAAVITPGPVYFRITRYTLPALFDDDYQFRWGHGVTLREGQDVTLVGTGMMTGICLDAADLLERDGLHAEVIHCGSVKPIDETLIASSASKTGTVVTAENASIIGGLGSAVAEVLGECAPAILRRVGVRDRFVSSGGTQELLAYHGMTAQQIAETARQAVGQKMR